MEDIGAMETVFGELARASEGDLGVSQKMTIAVEVVSKMLTIPDKGGEGG